jgi:hypothetical protein
VRRRRCKDIVKEAGFAGCVRRTRVTVIGVKVVETYCRTVGLMLGCRIIRSIAHVALPTVEYIVLVLPLLLWAVRRAMRVPANGVRLSTMPGRKDITSCVSGPTLARTGRAIRPLVPAKQRDCQTAFSAETSLPHWCAPQLHKIYIYRNAVPRHCALHLCSPSFTFCTTWVSSLMLPVPWAALPPTPHCPSSLPPASPPLSCSQWCSTS